MDFFGEVHCDFIGELKKRHMVHLTEQILFQLDVDSVRNARLVSKMWASAVFECNKKIWRYLIKHGNGHRNLRLLLSKHLEPDFPVPVEDEFYDQRFCNTVYLSSKEISRASLEQDFTIDYLPYSFPEYFSMLRHQALQSGTVWHHFEMDDSYIVAMDPSKPKMKYWSRRFLMSPPKGIDMLVLEKEIHQNTTGRNFRLLGANLVVGCGYFFTQENKIPDPLSSIHPGILTLRLKANSNFSPSLIDETQENRYFTLFDPSPLGLGEFVIRYLTVEGKFLLVVFEHCFAGLVPNKNRLVVWVMDELDSSSPWKFLEVSVTLGDHYFMDDEYLVVLNCENGLPTTFLVFSMLERETGRPREIATIAVDDDESRDKRISTLSDQVHYKNGFLVIASCRGDVRFVEVKSGRTVRIIQTKINFSAPGSLMRLSNSSEFFYLCFPGNPRGTVFQQWNFTDVIKSESSLEPLASFNAFTGEILDFKFDELGIVAVMKEEGRHGMQILSFLPQCSGCKRISKRTPLKSCSRCKKAKYCSRECQQSNWSHHKAICSKLVVIN